MAQYAKDANFYKYIETLGLNEDFTDKELKAAYRKLSKKYHPDMPDGDEEKFKEVNAAYHFFTEYDQTNNTSNGYYTNQADFSNHFHDINDIFNTMYRNSRAKPETYHYTLRFNGKTIMLEDFYDNLAFVEGVFSDPRFDAYHRPRTNHPNSFVHYKSSTGENRRIISFWKDCKGFEEQIIFKTFSVWKPGQNNDWLKIKLEKTLLYAEQKQLDRYFHNYLPLDCYPFFKKYVEMYLTIIDGFKEQYTSNNLELYSEIAKCRKKICEKMARDYQKIINQSNIPFDTTELQNIINEGISTFLMYASSELTASDISDKVLETASEEWIASYTHTAEDFQAWQDTISLHTSFSILLGLFYSNVLFKVYMFFSDNLEKLNISSYTIDDILLDLQYSKRLVITEEDLVQLGIKIPNNETVENLQENEVTTDQVQNQSQGQNQRTRKRKWWPFSK